MSFSAADSTSREPRMAGGCGWVEGGEGMQGVGWWFKSGHVHGMLTHHTQRTQCCCCSVKLSRIASDGIKVDLSDINQVAPNAALAAAAAAAACIPWPAAVWVVE